MKYSYLVSKAVIFSVFLISCVTLIAVPSRVSAQTSSSGSFTVSSDIVGDGGGVDGTHASSGPSSSQQGSAFSTSLSESKFGVSTQGEDLIGGYGIDEFGYPYELGCDAPTITPARDILNSLNRRLGRDPSTAFITTQYTVQYGGSDNGGDGAVSTPCTPGGNADLTKATLVSAPAPSGVFPPWLRGFSKDTYIQSYDSDILNTIGRPGHPDRPASKAPKISSRPTGSKSRKAPERAPFALKEFPRHVADTATRAT